MIKFPRAGQLTLASRPLAAAELQRSTPEGTQRVKLTVSYDARNEFATLSMPEASETRPGVWELKLTPEEEGCCPRQVPVWVPPCESMLGNNFTPTPTPAPVPTCENS